MGFTVRDLFKQPLTADELRGLAARVPVAELFSWKSPTARRRGMTPGSLTEDEMLRAMASEPRLIRRPLIVTGERVVISADRRQLEELA